MKRTFNKTASLLALLFAIAWAAPSLAQDSSSDAQRAKKYYKRGMQAFYKDDFAMAITNFKRAHSISPSGTLLYNISIAYSRMGKPGEAMTYSEKATEHDDLPEDTVVKNRARIAGYSVAMEAESLTPNPDQGRRAGTGNSNGYGVADTKPAAPATDTGGGNTLAWLGAGIGLTGAGLLAGAGVLTLDVQGKIEEKRTAEKNGDLQRANQLYTEIQSQQTTGQMLLYSGAGAFALGTTLFIIDLASSGSSSKQTARPVGGPHGDGWSFGVAVDF